MNKVILIGCTKAKDPESTKAEDIYKKSSLYKKSLRYAKTFNCPINILSAKYHVLDLNDPVEYYNKTLKTMKKPERLEWASIVRNQLEEKYDINNTTFVMLCGEIYYKDLNLPSIEEPLKGLPLGKRMQYLDSLVD